MKSHIAEIVNAGMLMLGFGQSGEGVVRVTAVREGQTRLLTKFPFRFESNRDGKWYNLDLLRSFWTRVHGDLGSSLTDLIRGVRIFGVTYWGADLILLDGNLAPIAAVNYPSALHDTKLAKRIAGIDRKRWHMRLKGAAQDAYQPIGVLGFMFTHLPKDVWAKVRYIVPVTDWLCYTLTGKQGHDVNMLQSMGLLGDAKTVVAELFAELFGERLPGELCPWPVMDTNTIMQIADGAYVAPFSHDSIWARLHAPVTGWMGTWCGGAILNCDGRIAPCDATLAAQGTFEGFGGHQAFQKNTGMHGATYEQLVQLAELTFPQAAEVAAKFGPLPCIAAAELNCRTPQEAAGFVQGMLQGKGLSGSREEAMAAVLQSLAASIHEDLQQLATAAGMSSVHRVAVVGGFADNPTFAQLLRGRGLDVYLPPHARDATEFGYLADAVRRYLLAVHGAQVAIADILPELPDMVRG